MSCNSALIPRESLARQIAEDRVISENELQDKVDEFHNRLLEEEEARKLPRGPNGRIIARERIEKRVISFSSNLKREQETKKKLAAALEATKPVEPEVYRYQPPLPRPNHPPKVPLERRESGLDRLFKSLTHRIPEPVAPPPPYTRRPKSWENSELDLFLGIKERKKAEAVVVVEEKKKWIAREWVYEKKSSFIKKAVKRYFELD